jgi:hypothetical protein
LPELIETEVTETPSEIFARIKAARTAAQTPEALAAKAAADKTAADAAAAAAVAPVVPEKRASGDERKFKNIEKRFNQSLGRLQEKLDQALAAKPAAADVKAAVPGAAPKREDFAADQAGAELFADAKTTHSVEKALGVKAAADAQAQEIRDTLKGYNERMAAAPEKYPDWAEVLAAGTGGALSVDLGKECPALFWAIARSPYNDDCFYEWLKDASKLQGLIDTYKSGPKGEVEALTAFHRFEGRVGKDAPVKKDPKAEAAKVEADKLAQKASDDAAARAKKPKPSAETSVKGGEAAPAGAPALFVAGTHTLNPAYKTWKRAQRAA